MEIEEKYLWVLKCHTVCLSQCDKSNWVTKGLNINNLQADYSGIKIKYGVHMIRPHP